MKATLLRRYTCALLLGVIATLPASGTTVERLSLDRLVDEAAMIFQGTAIASEVTVEGTLPFTYVTFEVQEVFKGATEQKTLTIRLEGGETAEEIVEVVGMPTFELDQSYLLFLRTTGERGGCPVLGWWQGSLKFQRHPETRRNVLVDHSGTIIQSIEKEQWQRAPAKIQPDGTLKTAQPAIRLLQEEGVTITGLADEDSPPQQAIAVRDTLDDLHNLIRSRRSTRDFKPGHTLRSVYIGQSLALPKAGMAPTRTAEGS